MLWYLGSLLKAPALGIKWLCGNLSFVKCIYSHTGWNEKLMQVNVMHPKGSEIRRQKISLPLIALIKKHYDFWGLTCFFEYFRLAQWACQRGQPSWGNIYSHIGPLLPEPAAMCCTSFPWRWALSQGFVCEGAGKARALCTWTLKWVCGGGRALSREESLGPAPSCSHLQMKALLSPEPEIGFTLLSFCFYLLCNKGFEAIWQLLIPRANLDRPAALLTWCPWMHLLHAGYKQVVRVGRKGGHLSWKVATGLSFVHSSVYL